MVAWADVPLDHVQSLSPLLVIMRVARHRHLHRDSEMVTADKFLSVPVPGPFCHQTGLQTRSSKQIRMTDSRCLYYCQLPDTAPAKQAPLEILVDLNRAGSSDADQQVTGTFSYLLISLISLPFGPFENVKTWTWIIW